MSFQAQLLYLVAWILRRPAQAISPQTDFRNDLDLDSMDFDLMIFRLETFYKTEFSTEQIARIRTVQDIDNILRP